MAERFNQKVNLSPVNTDLAQPHFTHAQNLQRFAAEMGQVGRQYAAAGEAWGQYADKKSIARGKKQAEADIASGKLTERKSGPTLGDKAYNELMQNAYLQSLAMDTEQDLRRIESESKSLEQYNQSIEAYKKGKMKEIEPAIAAGYATTFDKLAHSGRMRTQEREITVNKKNAAGELERTLNASFDTWQRVANEGAPDEIEFAATQFESNLSALQKSDPNTYTSAWADEQRVKASKIVSNQSYMRDFDSALDQGLEAGIAKLDELSKETPKGYNPPEWEDVLGKMQAKLNGLLSQQKAGAKSGKAYLSYLIDQSGTAIDSGAIIPDNDIAAMTQMAMQYEDPVQLAKLRQLKNRQNLLRTPVENLEAYTTGTTIGAGNADTYNNAKQALEVKKAAYAKDPIGFAQQTGLIESVPLDWANPESLKLMTQNALKVQADGNLDRVPSPITEADTVKLVNDLPFMTVDQKMVLINQSKVFGPAQNSFLKSLNEKGAGVFAMTAAIDDTAVQMDILKGQERKQAGVFKEVSGTDKDLAMDAFQGYVGNAYGDANAGLIFKTAMDHYAATAESTFDKKSFLDSVKAVTGGVGEYNGSKFELPRGVQEWKFNDYVENFDESSIEYFGGTNIPTDKALDLVRKGRIVSTSQGFHVVDERGAYLLNREGKKFTFKYDVTAPVKSGKSVPIEQFRTPY